MSKLIPDIEPITIVTIDSLTTDFNIDGFNQGMSNIVDPTEAMRAVTWDFYLGESHLKIDTVNQITVS